MTLSRNRGGNYLRARAIPVNPNTQRQGDARANLAQAVGAWTNTLNSGQRDGWNSYATSTPVVDVLGDQLILSGQQMFVKCMLPRLVAGLALIPAAPIIAGLATTPLITTAITLEEGSGLAGGITVPDAGVTGDLNVYMSEPTPQSRTLAHAKRAFALVEAPPVANVFTIAAAAGDLPYGFSADLGVRFTFVFLADDGRVSTEVFQDVVATV